MSEHNQQAVAHFRNNFLIFIPSPLMGEGQGEGEMGCTSSR